MHTVFCQQFSTTLDIPAVEVIHQFWVNVKEHRHVHLLAPTQPLLLKAEALDLVEVISGLVWDHIVSGHTSDGLRAAGQPHQALPMSALVGKTQGRQPIRHSSTLT